MTISYSITKSADESTTSASIVLSDGTLESISHLHAKFSEIVAALVAPEHDEEAIAILINPGRYIGPALTSVSDRFAYEAGVIRFDGQPIHQTLQRVILDRLESGDDQWAALAKFAVLLDENPSQTSQEHLYHFIQANGLQITPEGYIVAYKGVRDTEDNRSIHTGPFTSVDGVLFEPEGDEGIPNPIGAVVSIPRNKVNDNRHVGCSNGLHAGAWSYAEWFANYGRVGKILTVEIHPANVVSVPSDSSNQKLRVSEYRVLDVTESPKAGTTVNLEPVADVEPEGDQEDVDAFEPDYEEGQDDYLDHGDEREDDETEVPPLTLEGVTSLHDAIKILSAPHGLSQDLADEVLALVNSDLGQSETAREINEITSPYGFTTTRDSVRRYRTRK